MAVRERQLSTFAYSSGGTTLVDIPRDAVYHWKSLSCMAGTFTSVQGVSGTGPQLESNFPFSIMKQVRLIRNGSDVVFSGSGAQLAKEAYYLNKSHPFARIYTVSSQTETLKTATVRGVTIPANSQGIGSNSAEFAVADAASSSSVTYFDMQVDLWLQNGADDSYYATLVDARKLASYQLEIVWQTADNLVSLAGTANTSQSIAASFQLLSIDQDNLDVDNEFGTFKRSTLNDNNFTYGSNNNQRILNRGNFYQGIIMQTRAYKNGRSATVPSPDDAIISTIENRINSNFSLRKVNFPQLQAKNIADGGGRQNAFQTAQGEPQGFAYLGYLSAASKFSELVPTYVMDQFDLQISIVASASQQNGAVLAASNPLLDYLLEEIIPAVSVGGSAPRGSMAGSVGKTSAKPFSR